MIRLLHTFIQKLCFVRFLKLLKKQLSNKPFFEVLKCPYYLPFSTCNNQQFDFIISFKNKEQNTGWLLNCCRSVYIAKSTSWSVLCDRSVVFSGYSGFLHQLNWLPTYSWNIVESGIKHQNPNPYTVRTSKNKQYFISN